MCAECRTKRAHLERQARGPAGAGAVPSIVHEVLGSTGAPLDARTRAEMEPRFGHSFAQVRVHADVRAAESAASVQARAYAVGSDVVFGAGEYRPGALDWPYLLAHELAHVVQQGGAAAAGAAPTLEIGREDAPEERAARAAADAVAHGRSATVARATGRTLRRVPVGEWDNPAEGSMTGLLPYREATELLECIRIMGEGSREQCLEEVMAERPFSVSGGSVAARSDPLSDMSTFQSPGASGWWGARFGCYRDRCTRPHRGWDLHATVGTPILAAEGGTVSHHTEAGGLGDFIRLQSAADPTVAYIYAHLSARRPRGAYAAGDVIGDTGTSGNASANRPHLHFQVQENRRNVDPAGRFTEPTQVVEAVGSAVAPIDRTLPEPCAPCAL